MTPQPLCIGCDKTADQLREYVDLARSEGHPDAATAVRVEEGTYNPANGHFLCTGCYIAAGQPTAPGGWRAP
jgi:hypothetical protein